MAEEEDPLESLNDQERSFLTRIVATKILPTLEALARGGTAFAFEQWIQVIAEQKAIEAAIKLEIEVKTIMRESVRGQRTFLEKETLKHYLSSLSCLPSEVVSSAVAMDTLCNEIDSVSTVGKSILFLQGDFGNVYYMIAKGSVKLYLEKSKDKEMQIGREFGALRGVPYPNSAESLDSLGINIATLNERQGFGEFAILSQTGKLRMCAAVAVTDESFLFVLHANTYNTVLRQHHYRSKQLSACTALLQELPIFNTYSYSKLSNIAYGMKSSLFSNGSTLVKVGTKVKFVMIVSSGQVKVIQPQHKIEAAREDGVFSQQELMEMRLPKLAHAMLGRGSIIGQRELQPNCSTTSETFGMTYIASGHECEVFEMPANLYRECCTTPDILAGRKVQALNAHLGSKDQEYKDRIGRAKASISEFSLAGARSADEKDQLLRLLPLLIDGVTLDGGVAQGAGEPSHAVNTFNMFNKSTTAADIIANAAKNQNTEWFDGGGLAYGYDPSASREANMSTSDLFNATAGPQTKTIRTTPVKTPVKPSLIRPSETRSSSKSSASKNMGMGAGARIQTPGKTRLMSPSPRASKTLYSSVSASVSASASAPTTPRAPVAP